MAENDNHVQALEVFYRICMTLAGMNFKENIDYKRMQIILEFPGEDLPIELEISVMENVHLIQFISILMFRAPEEKIFDMVTAVDSVNARIADGDFEYDINNRYVYFRLTESYNNREVTEDMIKYLFQYSTAMIDKYNDRFFMVSKGAMSIDELLNNP